MLQPNFKVNKFYLYIAAGSLLSIQCNSVFCSEITESEHTKKTSSELVSQSGDESSLDQNTQTSQEEDQKINDLKNNLESVSSLLKIAHKVVADVCQVLDGNPQAFKEIANTNIESIKTAYKSVGNKEIDDFSRITVSTLKKVIDFFGSYQNKGEDYALDFVQKGEKVLNFDTVIAIMNRYRNALLEAARKVNNTKLEQDINALCAFILAKKDEFDKKTQNPIFVINNISRALGGSSKQPTRGRKK